MVSESEKYGAGRSGYGGADYASAAWRAGDLERSRLQSEETAARSRASLMQAAPGSNSGYSSATYSESSGGGFTFFAVLAFVVASIYGIAETAEYFFPHIKHEILAYVGPDGFISKNVFLLILVASLSAIGYLLRNVLRWVVGIGLTVALVGGAISLYFN